TTATAYTRDTPSTDTHGTGAARELLAQGGMKKRRPKALKDQVIVITGASSGIGLSTARMAAKRGARVVLAARNRDDLTAVTDEIVANGGQAIAVICDVADEAAVARLGEAALLAFGTLDTWVNNAGLSIYGKLADIPLDDKRRLFDINFWGVVHGCRTAVRLMKDRGGVLINIGSEVSDIAIPLQGIYSASKHAVKGYTDAILHCAERPVRDIIVGGAGRVQVAMGHLAPRLTDAFMERAMFNQQKGHDRTHQAEGNLYRPQRDGRAHGPYRGHVMKSSAYTRAALSDVTRALPFVAAGVALAAGVRRWRAA